MKRLAYSLLLLTAVANADTAKPEPKKTDVLRWDDFSGPELETPARDGEAFVVSPIQSGNWQRGLSFALAPVVNAEPHALVVQGPFHRFAVPAAFVAPPVNPTQKLSAGSYVLFQKHPTLTLTVHLGRVKKVGKDAVTIAYDFAGEVDTDDIAPNHVILLDGKIGWGAPVSFTADDGKPALGWYITAGRDATHAWVLSVGKPFEVEKPKPLKIQAFKKGAKVSAVFGTTSVLTLKDGKQPPARQYLEAGTVVEVLNGGLSYKVKKAEGGEVSTLDADAVFVR